MGLPDLSQMELEPALLPRPAADQAPPDAADRVVLFIRPTATARQ